MVLVVPVVLRLADAQRDAVVPMGRHQRYVARWRRLLVLSEPEQLLDGERRSMLVELARRRGRRRRRRSLMKAGRQPERAVQVGRAEERPGAEAERRRAGVHHRRRFHVLRQAGHLDFHDSSPR